METVRVLDPTLQLESRRVGVEQLPGFDLPNELTNALAHMAAVEGDTTKLLNATDGKLHVLDAQLATLQTALVGAGDKGLDDILTEALALKLALVGAGDKGLDDIFTELQTDLYHAGWGRAIDVLHNIDVSLESIDLILTDVYDAGYHYLKTHETA